jgi:tripartite ATP-independent transporter DctM subunit
MMSLLLTGLFLLLLTLRVPVSMAIGLAVLPPLVLLDRNLAALPQFMIEGVHSSALLAVPFFILAGNLFTAMGLSRRIWAFAAALVGHWRGGLAHVMVVANMIFAGISGSALADAAGLGAIGIPEMEKHGFRRRFATAITLCSSVIGPMIPPSINLILYGVIAQVSIGRLFIAGIVPGIVIGLALMLTVWLMARSGIEACPVRRRAAPREVGASFVSSVPVLLVPILIVAGMGFGIITPTEVGVVAIVYALAVGAFYRETSVRELARSLATSAKSTVAIMYIIAVSTVAGWIYAYDGTSQRLAEWLFALSDRPFVVLLLINLFLLVLGCLLEPIPLLILTAPIVLPIVHKLGVDPVQFGIVMNLNITIGIITPPMGIGLYLMVRVADVTFEELVAACLPLLVPLLACLLLFTYVPGVSLWLPDLIMGPG